MTPSEVLRRAKRSWNGQPAGTVILKAADGDMELGRKAAQFYTRAHPSWVEIFDQAIALAEAAEKEDV